MNKQWKLISGCAPLGLLITGFLFVFVGVLGTVDGTLYTAMVILCPASMLSIPFSEAMKDKNGFYVICLSTGLLNSGLYAVVEAATQGSSGRTTNEPWGLRPAAKHENGSTSLHPFRFRAQNSGDDLRHAIPVLGLRL